MPHIQNALEGWIDPRIAGTSCCVCGHRIGSDTSRVWISSPKQPGVEIHLSAGIEIAAHASCVNGMDVDELCRLHQQACYAVITGRHMGVL